MKASTFIGLGLLGFSLACRFGPGVADFYAQECYPLLSAGLSWCASPFPFSLEEITAGAFVLAFIVILVRAIRKKRGFWRWLGRTAALLMWLLVDKAGLYYMFAKVITSATVMFWSFFSRKIFLEQR